VNFYAMKNNGGVAWSPILGQGNFHKASRFGKVTFAVPGMTPPAASAAASGAPAMPVGEAGTLPPGMPRPFRGMRPGMRPGVTPPGQPPPAGSH